MVKYFQTSDEYIAKKILYLLGLKDAEINKNNNIYEIFIEDDYLIEALRQILKYHELEPLNLQYVDSEYNIYPIGYFPFINIYYDRSYSKEDAEAWNIKMDIKHNPREIRYFLSMLKDRLDSTPFSIYYDYYSSKINANINLLDIFSYEKYQNRAYDYINKYSYVFPAIDMIELKNIDGSTNLVIPNDKERLKKEHEERLKQLKLKN